MQNGLCNFMEYEITNFYCKRKLLNDRCTTSTAIYVNNSIFRSHITTTFNSFLCATNVATENLKVFVFVYLYISIFVFLYFRIFQYHILYISIFM